MKHAVVLLIVACLCIGMSGCNLLNSGSYVSVEPHKSAGSGASLADLQASSYPQMCDALCTLINNGTQSGVIYLYDLTENAVHSYMEVALRYIYNEYPVGVYAVEHIDYEVGMNGGKFALAVKITYSRSHTELLKIKYTENMQQLESALGSALESCEGSLVLLVDNYESLDYAALVNRYAQKNAHLVMELPQVMVAVYPDIGDSRLVELTFTYHTPQQRLLELQELVRPVFLSAELYVQGVVKDYEKLSLLYSFLMERTNYTVVVDEASVYSLLYEGRGNSYAFASAYATMCTRAGIECNVVTGTRNAEKWHWNELILDGNVYYADLLASKQKGELVLCTEENMAGYHW